MIFKRVPAEVGFTFKGMEQTKVEELEKEILNNNLKLLLSGKFSLSESQYLYFFEYSVKLNLIVFSAWEEVENGKKDNYMSYVFSTREEMSEFLKRLLKGSEKQYWISNYAMTDFELDYRENNDDHSKMVWRKYGKVWVARGQKGKFTIKHLHRHYEGNYEGELTSFKLRPNKYLSMMKKQCQENYWWEN